MLIAMMTMEIPLLLKEEFLTMAVEVTKLNPKKVCITFFFKWLLLLLYPPLVEVINGLITKLMEWS